MTTTPEAPTIEEAAAVAVRVLDEVGKAIVGKQEALRLCAILAKGHVLLEDYPGLGKTLPARSFARALGLDFKRAQFTPDLLPSDLTGPVHNQRTAEFEFRRGPLFTGLLLADEINRTPPKTQSALLEAMQERQITVEGETFPLAEPFHVLATANPIEYEGTYPLPEAQLDRFLLRSASATRPPTRSTTSSPAAWRAARRRSSSRRSRTQPGCAASRVAVEDVGVTRASAATAWRWPRPPVCTATPTGASPRGSLGLVLTARAFAASACAAATTSFPRT